MKQQPEIIITETESSHRNISSSFIDNRPFVQRVSGPRPARRLNHAFQHLYRHDYHDMNSTNNTTTNNSNDAMEYLMQYVSKDTVLKMNQTFPSLLTLSVKGQLYPKMKFLQDTVLKLSSTSSSSSSSSVRAKELRFLLENTDEMMIPPQFFGTRLERTLAPRHAFLVHAGLPHGRDLFFPMLQQDQQDIIDHPSSLNNSTTHIATRGHHYAKSKWHDFLIAQRNSKHFAALCQSWQQQQQTSSSHDVDGGGGVVLYPIITFQQVEAFDAVFSRGLMAAARNEWKPITTSTTSVSSSLSSLQNEKERQQNHNDDSSSTSSSSSWWPWQHLHKNLTSAQILELLIQHGANPKERDYRGATLLHWAAGVGNLPAVKVLLKYWCAADDTDTFKNTTASSDDTDKTTTSTNMKRQNNNDGVWTITTRDGATPLHWAAAGASAREFGTGGHVDVCRYLMDQVTSSSLRQDYVNQQTFDGNSALMWAAWSGSLNIVQLLVRESSSSSSSSLGDASTNKAAAFALDVTKNRNGCTVAHWAASGGNLDVCRFLYETGVDFTQANHAGNTPLTHAVAFGRANIVTWLKDVLARKNNENTVEKGNANSSSTSSRDDDMMAFQLAQDYVHWTNGKDRQRQQVLDIFQDW